MPRRNPGLGQKIADAIGHYRSVARDAREQADAIDAAWKNEDWESLVDAGVITAADLRAYRAEGAKFTNPRRRTNSRRKNPSPYVGDSLSRFSPVDPLEGMPALKKKVLRALASKTGKSVALTPKEAAFLIAERGGPDPYYTVPQQMFIYQNQGLVVRGGSTPLCFRLN